MADTPAQPFRFLHLPGEIRNKIYRELLCSFDPPPDPTLIDDGLLKLKIATHSIDTAILHTSRQVHREAFDVMVKTNRFVKISTVNHPLDYLVRMFQVPLVCIYGDFAERFPGCVMRVNLSYPVRDSDEPGVQNKVLILRRDWGIFCGMLREMESAVPRFGKDMKIEIRMNGYPEVLPDYVAPIGEYFTVGRQRELLSGTAEALRGYAYVHVEGSVDEEVASEFRREVTGEGI